MNMNEEDRKLLEALCREDGVDSAKVLKLLQTVREYESKERRTGVHPSGDPTPSEEDLSATQKLEDATKLIGIKLVDHLILGDPKSVDVSAFLSLKEWLQKMTNLKKSVADHARNAQRFRAALLWHKR